MERYRSFTWLATVLLIACASTSQPFRFLHSIPTETDAGYHPDLPLTVSIDLEDPTALRAVLPTAAIVDQNEQRLVVRLEPYPALVDSAPAPLEPSFLVDYEEPSVHALIANRSVDARPSLEELVAWVQEAIEPSSDRGFDAASVIARVGRGDCTEFAVLMAALARSFGYPTRVVTGLVVVRSEKTIQAFGHAWNEVRRGQGWQLLDATPIEGGVPIGYLPQGAIENEGPGYALDLLGALATGISGVRILAAEEQRPHQLNRPGRQRRRGRPRRQPRARQGGESPRPQRLSPVLGVRQLRSTDVSEAQ